MARVIFVGPDGVEHDVDAEDGHSLMEAAVRSGIDAIRADCGGGCACATCHVHVDEAWVDRVAAASETEALMLEFVTDRRMNSRLSCQIDMGPFLDGLRVALPAMA